MTDEQAAAAQPEPAQLGQEETSVAKAQIQPPSLWKRTDKWKPATTGTASGCYGVESVGSDPVIGLFKPKDVPQEKICADLARAVGVKVPEVHLGKIEGTNEIGAVSIAHGKVSQDLQWLQQQAAAVFASPKMQQALAAASGIIAFHAWVGTVDVKDAHLLVAEDDGGAYVVAAVDFADALKANVVQAPPDQPASLVKNVDKQVVRTAVEKIEKCSNAEIESIVNAIPDELASRAEKDRIIEYLKARRGQVRNAMQQKGWI